MDSKNAQRYVAPQGAAQVHTRLQIIGLQELYPFKNTLPFHAEVVQPHRYVGEIAQDGKRNTRKRNLRFYALVNQALGAGNQLIAEQEGHSEGCPYQ